MSYQLHDERPCDCCDGAEMGFAVYTVVWNADEVDTVVVGRNCAQWFSDQLQAQIAAGRSLDHIIGYEFEGPWATLSIEP
jgi:hypothetical protein